MKEITCPRCSTLNRLDGRLKVFYCNKCGAKVKITKDSISVVDESRAAAEKQAQGRAAGEGSRGWCERTGREHGAVRTAYPEYRPDAGAEPDDALCAGRRRGICECRKRVRQPEAEDLAGAEGHGRQHGAGGLLAALQPVPVHNGRRD